MANKKPSQNKKKKTYTFQFTFGSVFLLSLTLIFILGWVFSLGIMVGRGFLPSPMDTFSVIKGKMVKEKEKKKDDQLEPIREEELTFYNQLVNKKDSVKRKILSKPTRRNQDTTAKKTKVAKSKEGIPQHSVQVAALKDKGKTEKVVGRLIRLGYPAYYHQALINGEIYYRIRCGPFSSIKEARECAKQLADKEGFKPFVVNFTKAD